MYRATFENEVSWNVCVWLVAARFINKFHGRSSFSFFASISPPPRCIYKWESFSWLRAARASFNDAVNLDPYWRLTAHFVPWVSLHQHLIKKETGIVPIVHATRFSPLAYPLFPTVLNPTKIKLGLNFTLLCIWKC